jgi:hypothetical protein
MLNTCKIRTLHCRIVLCYNPRIINNIDDYVENIINDEIVVIKLMLQIIDAKIIINCPNVMFSRKVQQRVLHQFQQVTSEFKFLN